MFIFAILIAFGAVSYGVPLEGVGPRIIGGVDAPEAYAPYMVALLFGERFVFFACGGSLVSLRHVLTAAHCIEGFVANGTLTGTFFGRIGSNIWLSGGTIVQFKGFDIHPKWDVVDIKNDVGVLTLTEGVKLSETVAVIRLNFGWVGGRTKSLVTGWGVTGPRIWDDIISLAPTPDELQLLYMETLTHAECEKGMRAMETPAMRIPPIQRDVEICTFHSVGHGMCNGDSGSALVSVDCRFQFGLVSWGIPCAVGGPDVFVRLSGFKDYLLPILRTCPSFQG